MSYSEARSILQGVLATSGNLEIKKIAEALIKLSQAIEDDLTRLRRDARQLKNQ